MAQYIYARVSTSKQSFEQQLQDIINYGINPKDVDEIVKEHESGGKSYVDRKFRQLLDKCKSGDTIYAASTDRLGRSFVDMIRLMESAKERGIIIVACKQNIRLDDESIGTKILIAVTAIIDEDERMRVKHRTKNKKDWQKEQIATKGYFIIEKGENKGQKKTTTGSEKGHDTSAAREASLLSKREAVISWKENSIAFQWVADRIVENIPRKQIVEEFNKLHELQPDVFCTRTGSKLSPGILSKWIQLMNPAESIA